MTHVEELLNGEMSMNYNSLRLPDQTILHAASSLELFVEVDTDFRFGKPELIEIRRHFADDLAENSLLWKRLMDHPHRPEIAGDRDS